jgi:hypothetical protein
MAADFSRPLGRPDFAAEPFSEDDHQAGAADQDCAGASGWLVANGREHFPALQVSPRYNL